MLGDLWTEGQFDVGDPLTSIRGCRGCRWPLMPILSIWRRWLRKNRWRQCLDSLLPKLIGGASFKVHGIAATITSSAGG